MCGIIEQLNRACWQNESQLVIDNENLMELQINVWPHLLQSLYADSRVFTLLLTNKAKSLESQEQSMQ